MRRSVCVNEGNGFSRSRISHWIQDRQFEEPVGAPTDEKEAGDGVVHDPTDGPRRRHLPRFQGIQDRTRFTVHDHHE